MSRSLKDLLYYLVVLSDPTASTEFTTAPLDAPHPIASGIYHFLSTFNIKNWNS